MEGHNPKWSQITNHAHTVLIIGGSKPGNTNALLNLINHRPDVDKICLYAKDPHEAKYRSLINNHESVDLNHCNDFKDFIHCSIDMDDIYENIDEYNPNIKCQILIVFDYMFADMLNNKAIQPV